MTDKYVAWKDYNIDFLAIYRKSFLTPVLKNYAYKHMHTDTNNHSIMIWWEWSMGQRELEI